MVLDDRTHYDIGQPFITVRFDTGTISHTPKGIILSTDSGTRFTCSYSRLLSMLKNSCRVQDKFIEETNVNDIMSEFKKKCDAMIAKAQSNINQIIKEQNEIK